MQAVSEESIAHDIAAINRIEAVPTILKAVAHATGMRFAAVARGRSAHRHRAPAAARRAEIRVFQA